MDFQTWAETAGETPGSGNLTEWLRQHPEVADEIRRGIVDQFTWDQAAAYAAAQGFPPCSGESLRKAVGRLG